MDQGQGHQSAPHPKKPRILLWVGIIATLVLVLGIVAVIAYGYAARPRWVGVSDKIFWDYLELLIVPAVLAVGAAWLGYIQSKRSAREALDAQRERERNEENQRQRELRIASLRAQDEALQAYLGYMSELLMNDSSDKRLRNVDDRAGDNLRVLARARTLTLLGQLEEGDRKGSVLRFLYEAHLITPERADEEGPPVLYGPRESLGVIDLSGANLGYAELRNAFLRRAALGSRYKAPGVYLWYAKLRNADLESSDLRGAILSHADLSSALLNYVDLTNVTAIRANFSGANLSGANLSKADLSGAQGITNEELDQQAKSLEGATMPNGQKYEDWLKDKEDEKGSDAAD